MTILVTGGAGFIVSNFVMELLAPPSTAGIRGTWREVRRA